MTLPDEIIDRVQEARETLIKKHGGFDGWFKHLQAKDRKRRLAKKRSGKTPAKKRRTITVHSKP